MEEKKPHPNQYKPRKYTCNIIYTPGCEKAISDFQDKKVQMLRKHLEGLSSQELDLFIERLEESYNRKKVGDENTEK
jgi:hypothetical protein